MEDVRDTLISRDLHLDAWQHCSRCKPVFFRNFPLIC